MKRGEKLFSIVVLGTPRPKSRPRFVNGRVVSTTSKHEDLWRGALEKTIRPARPVSPIDRALIVDASFFFEAKTVKRLGRPHTHKPDKDNLEKLCWDVLVKERVIKDDALVAGGETTKEWQMRGGAVVEVYEALSD